MRVKLKDAFNLQMGKTPSRADLSMWGGNNKWISIADIGSAKKYISSTKECITDEGVSRSGIKVVPEGTVIMSFKLSIGKTAIVSEDMYTNEAIMAFIDNGTYCIDPNYLYHLCCGTDWTQGGNKAVMGLTLNKATLSEMEIELPTIEEQREIASKLDQLDAIIEKRHDELNMIEQLVKSRFIELFGDPIRNEKGWPIVTLGEVAEIRIGPFGSLLHREDYIVGGHALVNPSHIIDGNICTDDNLTVSDEKYEELSAYRLSIGDLVLGRRGEMGRCAVVYEDGLLCGTGSIIIRPKEKMKPYFLQNIISSPGYKRIIEDKAVGVTMMNLNVPIVSSLTIPLLPIDMQEQFIAFMHQTDKSKFFACQTLSFLLKLANNLQSWREKQYDY